MTTHYTEHNKGWNVPHKMHGNETHEKDFQFN